MTDLETWASVATIAAVPIAILGWFISASNKTTAKARGSSTAIAGDVSAAEGSLAIGHGNHITINETARDQGASLKRHISIGPTEIYTVQINAGDYWECASHKIKVSVIDVVTDSDKSADKGCSATLRVDTGGGIIHGGKDTDKISVNTYRVRPNNSTSDREPDGLYRYLYSDDFFSFLSVSVVHINPFKNEATIEVCRTRVLKGFKS